MKEKNIINPDFEGVNKNSRFSVITMTRCFVNTEKMEEFVKMTNNFNEILSKYEKIKDSAEKMQRKLPGSDLKREFKNMENDLELELLKKKDELKKNSLMGKLNPIEGIGPKDIGMQKLIERASDGVVQEIILATNFTAEGEATAHVLSDVFKRKGLAVTRLARGVPVGSELEYVDLGTIAHALVDRRST
jgi:hypothetical protein